MSRFMEKYHIYILMYGLSQIQGTRSKKMENYGTNLSHTINKNLDLVHWRITIHSSVDLVIFQQSWHICLCWKITRTTFQCMVVPQFRGQKFILVEIWWSQDLRVEHTAHLQNVGWMFYYFFSHIYEKCFFKHLLIFTGKYAHVFK